MQIIPYNFTKKKNSTKQPSSGSPIDVTLKDNTSILRPTFKLSRANVGFNYLYVANFARYYFVNDITWINNDMAEVSCEVDPMASAKSDIIGSSFYIERSSSSYDNNISDSVVIPTTEIVQSVATAGDTLSGYDASGSFVCRVVGKNGSKNYLLNEGTLQNAFSSFFDLGTLDFSSVESALNAIFLSISDPASYIKSIKWFPFSKATSSSEICYFGYAPTSAAVPVISNINDATTPITKPARYYNDWRDYDSRFTSCSVFLPGIGNIDLDPLHLQGSLNVWYHTDVNTGAGVAILADGTDIISTHACQVGCDVPIGGLTGSNMITGLANTIGAAASLNIGATLSGVIETAQTKLQPGQSSVSASGNKKFWTSNPAVKINVTRLGSTGAPGATKGKPKKSVMALSGLSGYVLCSDASIETSFTAAEKDMINGYLNSGFYIE